MATARILMPAGEFGEPYSANTAFRRPPDAVCPEIAVPLRPGPAHPAWLVKFPAQPGAGIDQEAMPRRLTRKSRTAPALAFLLLAAGAATPALNAAFPSARMEDARRPWTGPDHRSNPLRHWRVRNGFLECFVAGGDRNVTPLSRVASPHAGALKMSVCSGRLEARDATGRNPAQVDKADLSAAPGTQGKTRGGSFRLRFRDRKGDGSKVEFERASRRLPICSRPRRVDPARPGAQPYEGWPITTRQWGNGNPSHGPTRQPVQVEVDKPLVQVIDPAGGGIALTMSIQGKPFEPRLRKPGACRVRAFDPDTRFERLFRDRHTG